MTKNWKRVPLWSVTADVRRVVDPVDLGAKVLHYSIPSLDTFGGPVVESTEDIKSAKQVLRGGELLISKLNPRKSRVMQVQESHLPMVASTEFVAMNALPALDRRFMGYLLSSDDVRQELDSKVQSVTRSHQRVTPSDIRHLLVYLPSLDEQRCVADFLDIEINRLSTSTVAIRSVMRLLDERRKALLHEALSGVNFPGDRYVHPMLGSLPECWPVRPLRRVVPRVGVGVVVDPSSYFAERGVPFLRGSNVLAGRFDLTDVKKMSELDSRRLWRSRLSTGDVVVVRAGDPGRAAVVPGELDGANCASILVLKKGEILRSEYLAAYFNSSLGKSYVDSVRYGAAQEQINVSHVVDFMVPVPTLDQQDSILRELGQGLADIESIEGKLDVQLKLLAERRLALITAAVNGQINVTTAGRVEVS